jgi:DeoR/GlpR family transcriptional regulator of sugar metabolism
MALKDGTPKSIKEVWKAQILSLKKNQLTVDSLAGIIGVSKTRIYRDLESKVFEGAVKKGKGLKSHWDFTHHDAIVYIESFDDNITLKTDKTPPTKKINFPGWKWE